MRLLSVKFAAFCALIFVLTDVNALEKEHIIGGNTADVGEFPYAVSLRRLKAAHFCGGVLISKRHVLTAAHCVYPYANNITGMNLTAVVGTNSLLTDGSYVKIESGWYHRNYTPSSKSDIAYDVGMYILEKEVMLSHLVQIVKLPKRSATDGERAVVLGWGVFRPPMVLSANLKKLEVRILNYTECGKIAPKAIHVTESHLCTLVVRGKGTCVGDSGGPLIKGQEVVGVVSGGIPCALGYPDVYSNIFYQLKEIRKKLKKDKVIIEEDEDEIQDEKSNDRNSDGDGSIFSNNKNVNVTIENVNVTIPVQITINMKPNSQSRTTDANLDSVNL